MADLSGNASDMNTLDQQARTLTVKGDDDIVRGGTIIRDMGFKVANTIDYVLDAIEDAVEDYDKGRRTRIGTLRSRAIVRAGRIYAAGLRQADRVARSIVQRYEKEFAEERAAARRAKPARPRFEPGTAHGSS